MTIQNAIRNIVDELFNVSDSYRSYQEEKGEILSVYRDLVLTEKLAEAERRAKRSVDYSVGNIQNSIDFMLSATKSGNAYDASSDAVANAAKLLSAKGVSRDAVKAVILPFIGNQTALSLIAASADPDYMDLIEPWMFDAIGTLEKAKSIAGSLKYDSIENYPSIIGRIRETVQDYAIHQGIELGELSGRIEALRTHNVVNLMGLNPALLK